MADLGAKGTLLGDALFTRMLPPLGFRKVSIPLLPGEGQDYLNVDVSGVISGVVKINNVVQPQVHVGLFHRSNMNQLAIANTDAFGGYSFKALDKSELKNYFVVVIDPREDSPYNFSLVRDHLTAG